MVLPALVRDGGGKQHDIAVPDERVDEAFGVLGQYLGRLYTQSKNRPLYIVGDYAGDLKARGSLGIVAHRVAARSPAK